MSDVIALLVRPFVVTVESEGTIPNAACQRRKVLALRLLSILHYVLLVLLPHFHPNLQNAGTSVLINGHSLIALIDSGSSDSFKSQSAATQLKLQVHPSTKNISMALTTMNTTVLGYCTMDIILNNSIYRNVRLSVLKDLCSDIILGHDFQKQHKNLIFEFGGPKPDLVVSNNSTCAVSAASIGEPSLFANVSPKCKPIAYQTTSL